MAPHTHCCASFVALLPSATFFQIAVTIICALLKDLIGWAFPVGQAPRQREPRGGDPNTDLLIDAPPATHLP